MLDILLEYIDIFLNLIIDDTVNKATSKNKRKNSRYILFSVFSAILLLVIAFMIMHTLETGNLVLAFLLIALSIVVIACWCRLCYIKTRRRYKKH